ncbi:MAG: STAS domain-containing protein [candidate division Zixibacteria bacterium]|nr:STAS domain-containing protein [candidate division Zixibacteria bacterium]
MSGVCPVGLHLSVAVGTADTGIHVIRADGVIDTLTCSELDMVLGQLLRQKYTRLIVDLAGIHYISSAGWGVFVSRLREARQDGGDIALARMTPPVRDIYDLLEFEGVLHHFDRLDAAEAHFGNGNGSKGKSHFSGTAPAPPAPSLPPSVPSPVVASLEDAVVQLVLEDPFYSIREMKERLREIGAYPAGRWAICAALWRRHLFRRRSRFHYYRRRAALPAGAP